MSYYILTPVSNLSKILASEAIAPAALYPMKSSGFRSFDRVSQDEPLDLLRLYKEIPTLPTSEDGNRAMAVMIPEKNVNPIEDSACRLWTSETIYLAPTRDYSFIFASDDELNAAFNRTRMSIEAKFADRYKKRAKVIKEEKPKTAEAKKRQEELIPLTLFDLEIAESESEPAPIGEPVPTASVDVLAFELADRIKGALYCFCLSECLSVELGNEEDYVKYMRTVDELVNSVTQMSLPALDSYKAALESILYRLKIKKEISSCDSAPFNLEERLKSIREDATVELPVGFENNASLLKEYRSSLETRIWDVAGERSRAKARPQIVDHDGVPMISIPKAYGSLAECLINGLASDSISNDTRRAIGYEFAKECGMIVREHIGTDWPESPERNYINGLLKHLNAFEPFDPDDRMGIENEQNYQTLKALALFCSKDDNRELDAFYRYLLIKRGISDFSLAFAIWGATFGFSQIPKILCDLMSEKAEEAMRKQFRTALEITKNSRKANRRSR